MASRFKAMMKDKKQLKNLLAEKSAVFNWDQVIDQPLTCLNGKWTLSGVDSNGLYWETESFEADSLQIARVEAIEHLENN